MTKLTHQSRSWISLLTGLIGLCLLSNTQGAHAKDLAAVWQSHAVNFHYVGRMTTYSCDSLVGKVTRVLAASGARGMKVDVKTCIYGGGQGAPLVQLASMQLDFSSAALANDATKRAIANDAGRRELLQRLGVAVLPTEEFPAEWKEVNVAADRRLQLGPGDCELLRELSRQVLTQMAVEVVSRSPSCSMSPQRLGKARLKLRALAPAGVTFDDTPEFAGLRKD